MRGDARDARDASDAARQRSTLTLTQAAIDGLQ